MVDMIYENEQDTEFLKWVENNKEVESEEQKFQRYFFIDYENVNRDGLNGILKLKKTDCVKIYYSDAAETLTFGLHRRIMASEAYFEYMKVQIPIKNAVDCQILFDIRDIIKINKEAEYVIVSKDTDFDRAIELFCQHKFKVRKIQQVYQVNQSEEEIANTIQQKEIGTENFRTITKAEYEIQIRSFFKENFTEIIYIEHKEEIIQIILNAKSKQSVNNQLAKIYDGKTVSMIYKIWKPFLKELPGR